VRSLKTAPGITGVNEKQCTSKLRMGFAFLFIAITACSGDEAQREKREAAQKYYRSTITIMPGDKEIVSFPDQSRPVLEPPPPNPERNAYFGDLHVHTTLSFDASAFGTTATPHDAYRYAQGEAIRHPSGFEVQLAQPLDFYAVTDHAVLLGVINEAADTRTAFSRHPLAEAYHGINDSLDGGVLDLAKRSRAFYNFVSDVVASLLDGSITSEELKVISRSAWADTVKAANEAYRPGHFTTFAGYEFTPSTQEREALHRNVIFRGGERLPAVPFSRFNSIDPEGLWSWMDELREQGIESLAIPHNSNGSNGAMFAVTDYQGNSIDTEYVAQRRRNEPLVEITQIKGTSDTHPLLSPTDEWADFEIFPLRTSTRIPSNPEGSYARNALQRGLVMEANGIGNPFQFGLVGSSDTHIAAASIEESSYFGKVGLFDSTSELRGSTPARFLYGTLLKVAAPEMVEQVDDEDYLDLSGYKYWGASGIAGVWAEENTRESIYDALRRKETFATSGPRMKVRFFAGYDFNEQTLDQPGVVADAYRLGVPMGGQLAANADKSPRFLVWAAADPNTANLQRIQIIKGWQHDGEHREQVYDVACSDDLEVDTQSHRCPDNGARVSLSDCSITADIGATELKTVWQDPDFEAGQSAFYYVRVLENPVCRWSTWDAIRSGEPVRTDLHSAIQERAWSSPIWYGRSDHSSRFAE